MLKASQNKNVLSCRLKAGWDDVLWIDSGRRFHAAGPAVLLLGLIYCYSSSCSCWDNLFSLRQCFSAFSVKQNHLCQFS